MRLPLLRSAPGAAYRVIPLIRLMVGAVFFTEGLQKFIYPALRGPGRFEKMGFPAPEFFGYFVGVFEVACGVLLLVGLLTRLAALAMAVNMTVAIIITKIPILFGEGLWVFTVRDAPFYNFWSMSHEMRTDWAMLLGALFLLVAGAGPFSLDRRVFSPRRPDAPKATPPVDDGQTENGQTENGR